MNDTSVTTDRKPASRDTRRPFGSRQQKLAYPPRPGYHRHWFNEYPGRIEDALAAGYKHVEDKEGRKVNRVVGVDAAGQPLHGFLMETPLEWYQEDMALQQKQIDETDSAIRRGGIEGTPGVDGRYIPESRGIKVQTGRN